jgi:uncharacterized coiled-coil protein SlyX
MRDPLVDLAEQGAEHGTEIARLAGRVDAVTDRLRPSRAEAIAQAGLHADPAAIEQSIWKKLSPWRSRWPEVHQFDERIAELEMQQSAILGDLQRLADRRHSAPARDAEALGAWELEGRKGERPEPTLPAIDADIERLQQELEGLRAAVDTVLQRKASFVEKHRKRLLGEATSDARKALAGYHEAIDALAQAREELRAARHDELWCALYPGELAGRDVPDSFCGERQKPLRRLGLNAGVHPSRVIEALHDDADWIRGAVTEEQYAAIHNAHPRGVRGVALWVDTPEGKEWVRGEVQQIERARQNPS